MIMQKYKYKISIVVPVYNSEQYIACCIDSIVRQTFRDFELILVNDGSTDGSEAICKSYACDYIKVYSQPNRGVSSARNHALDVTDGEYVIFVDSDDWLEPDALATLMRQEKTADITFFGSVFHKNDGIALAYIPDRAIYNSFASVQQGLLNLLNNPRHPDYVGFTWNKMFRNDIIREHHIRFIEGLSIREDEAFTYSYVCHCRTLCTLPDIIYNYRAQQTGLTFSKKTSREYIKLGMAYERAIDVYDIERLICYFSHSAAAFYFLALRRAKDKETIDEAVALFWNVHRKYSPEIRLKRFYKFIVKIESEKVLKTFFHLRILLPGKK